MKYRICHGFPALVVGAALISAAPAQEQNTSIPDATQRSTDNKKSARRTANSSQQPGANRDSRTDRSVALAIESRLQADRDVSAHLIDVSNEGGIITLSGTVDDLFAKERANQIAQSTRGVATVKNQLRVRPVARPDRVVQRDIVAALIHDPAAESYDIDVRVQDGIVTLRGDVQSYQEQKLAESLASSVRGVREIRNQIQIHFDADRPDSEVEADIRSRLKNSVHTSSDDIDVQVKDGIAHLTGTVGSAIEKTWAKANAWVFGVTDVNTEKLQVQTDIPSERERNRRTQSRNIAGTSQKNEARGGLTEPESGAGSQQRSTNKIPNDEAASRDDTTIREAVMDAFIYNPRVFSFNTEVSVDNGVVTLSGTVDNLKAKQAAEHAARNVAGVMRVKNLLKVRTTNQPPDEQLEQLVNQAIARTVRLDDDNINVWVLNGKAYLTGTVDSYSERVTAHNTVSGVRGVLDVDNRLNVPYTTYDTGYSYSWFYPYSWDASGVGYDWEHKTDAEIRQEIEDQMFWSPFVDADEVNVQVKNGVATLTGSVDSSSERRSATENAYDAGATSVRNQLRVYDNFDGVFDF